MNIINNLKLASLLLVITARTYALELKASTYLEYVNYQEFDLDGSSLNHETGFIPGIQLQASYKHHTLWSSYAYGNVHYDGQIQSGAPYNTSTNYILSSAGYEYEHALDQYNNINLLAGFSTRTWQRHILSNKGIPDGNAEYKWQQLHAGIRYQPGSIFNFPLQASLSVIKTRNGAVDVNLSNLGYGSPQLELGDEYGVQAGVKYYRRVSRKIRVNVSVDSVRWKFGRSQLKTLSNGINSITIAEPRSISWHTRLGVELEYRL